jgi:hypothetical protein
MADTETKGSRASRSSAARGNGDSKPTFQDAHHAYVVALQNAHLQAQRPFIDAYANYLQAVGNTSPNEPLNAVYAYQEYVRNVLEAAHGGEVSKLYDDAFREYARSLQAAWAALDVDSLDPVSLGAVVETVRAGVALAQSSARG